MTPSTDTHAAGTAPLDRPVAMIGPMGAGKSSIGKKLSRRLGVGFLDTDRLLVQRHGPVAEIFARDGEPRFRELEREVVAEALASTGVVSLGGGAVLDPLTRERLRGASVVLLTVTPEAVADRLAGSSRPLLAQGGMDAWRAIALEREPVYRSLADVVVDTSRRPVSHVVDDVVAWLAAATAAAAAGSPDLPHHRQEDDA
ncbi:shikimate kinase [Frigoribacterium sp. VKM Ac-2530]|uniref:shikimate kinase n=1 Tax=Frigoribacterium sp. VKM Ac-2530 TaxID=2783822 RepID=UPI00351C1C5A